MYYVVTDLGRLIQSYKYKGHAINAKKKQEEINKRYPNIKFLVVDHDELMKLRKKTVTVINLMSGKPCEIRACEVGTCCDPSTERYWTM